jgi:hypothetical protein
MELAEAEDDAKHEFFNGQKVEFGAGVLYKKKNI